MWNFIIKFCFLIVLFFSIQGAFAIDTQYHVGVGDTVSINVLSEKEFTGIFRVGSDGTIDYPYLRKIEVKGKTTEELARLFTDRLKEGYLADPQVTVEVKDFNSQKVLVLGAVSKPGPYILTENTRILDLISRAGGITSTGGKRILLLRGTKDISNEIQEIAQLAENKTEIKIDHPKIEEKQENKAQTDTEPKSSLTQEQKIFQKTSSVNPIVIDYYGLVHQGNFSQNLPVQDGDIINVPKANEIFVLGNVGRPGPIKYDDKMTILQAVTLAGGSTPTASTKSTYILRQGEGKENKISVNLDKVLKGKAENIELKADDVVVIPESFF